MTRQEFIDDVTTWGELLNFCSDEDCDLCEDIVDWDYVDDYVNDSLVDWARDNDWRSLLGILNNVDDNSGYDYYRYDDYEYVPVDDDRNLFEEYKDSVLEWMDDNDYWPDGDEDEEEEEETGTWAPSYSAPQPAEEPEDLDPIPDEDCSFTDMFAAGVGCIASINEEAIREAQEADRVFAEFSQFRR